MTEALQAPVVEFTVRGAVRLRRVFNPSASARARYADIEAAADQLFADYLGFLPWDNDATQQTAPHQLPERLIEASLGGEIVGFAELLEAGEYLHLEQLSVDPRFGRHGIGRALLEAVIREAAPAGFAAVTLRTFLEVPWNAPFYERCGFGVVQPPSAFHADLERLEAGAGLTRWGTRVHMLARVTS